MTMACAGMAQIMTVGVALQPALPPMRPARPAVVLNLATALNHRQHGSRLVQNDILHSTRMHSTCCLCTRDSGAQIRARQ